MRPRNPMFLDSVSFLPNAWTLLNLLPLSNGNREGSFAFRGLLGISKIAGSLLDKQSGASA